MNVLTLAVQPFFTAHILRKLGVALTLGQLRLARPTRELLFTVLPREDKYKAKNFIDPVVYRAGDQVGDE